MLAPRLLSLCVLFSIFSVGCATSGIAEEALLNNRAGADRLAAGDLNGAEARFHLALEYNRSFADPYANLGAVALERGHFAEAEHYLKTAIELNADFAEAWANLGVLRTRQHRHPEAREAYTKALEINPGLISARRNLAFLLADDSDWASARAQLYRLLELTPDDQDARAVLSFCELQLHRPDAARATLAEVPSPVDSPMLAFVRGEVSGHP